MKAGIDISQFTFKWIFFLLAYYQEVQKKLREEISSEIGDRIPLQEDRNSCHFVNAYISETTIDKNLVTNNQRRELRSSSVARRNLFYAYKCTHYLIMNATVRPSGIQSPDIFYNH